MISTISQSSSALVLSSGRLIPQIGLGVYLSEPGAETYNAIMNSFALGYRHVDTAQFYRNEEDVGRAIKDCGIPRDELFITTKLAIQNFGYDVSVAAIRTSFAKLQTTHIDLLLLHAPGDPEKRAETWRALEKLQAEGIIRDIGVSNFGIPHIEKLLETAKVKPVVNQIELHPWLQRVELVEYCRAKNILLQAYSPLAKASRLADPVVNQIAQKIGVTPAQVLVAWSIQKEFITLPKSTNPSRQRENLEAASKVKLSDEDMAKLDTLEEYGLTGWDPIKDHPV